MNRNTCTYLNKFPPNNRTLSCCSPTKGVVCEVHIDGEPFQCYGHDLGAGVEVEAGPQRSTSHVHLYTAVHPQTGEVQVTDHGIRGQIIQLHIRGTH